MALLPDTTSLQCLADDTECGLRVVDDLDHEIYRRVREYFVGRNGEQPGGDLDVAGFGERAHTDLRDRSVCVRGTFYHFIESLADGAEADETDIDFIHFCKILSKDLRDIRDFRDRGVSNVSILSRRKELKWS